MDREKIQRAADQATKMRAYFKDLLLPAGEMKIAPHIIVTDPNAYRTANLRKLDIYPVLSRYWQQAYYALYYLKKYLEDGSNEAIGHSNKAVTEASPLP